MTSDKPRVDDRAPATWRSRRFATGLAIAYGVALVLVGFWGFPVDAAGGPWLTRALAAAHRHGLPQRIDYATVESLANVAYFVPLGLLVVLLAGARWWWAAIAAGLVVSACIETGQALFLPARTATIDDVVANGVGALLGAVAGVLLLSRAAHRRR
ncbi:VanZ family protein [Curtobacterium aurantiacum]|uniref:VanZ family protein n=1 Tax=Curtobacterium aurantiacum TaxID=3236919 RepID=UPI001BDEE50D|nr:VanZ family protein [Curtobacterium flaccumfaciens]MBT1678574.1 VanZ family protein [Curtobacterium flaccumfaciens pv. flaccumfaciens]